MENQTPKTGNLSCKMSVRKRIIDKCKRYHIRIHDDRKEEKMSSVTIRDIAREANVSVATVSRTLNHSPNVTDAMRERVLATAEKLGYVPNSAAKSLKTSRSQIVGFLVSDITNHDYIRIAHTVENILRKKGYSLILCSTRNQRERELDYLQMLMSKNIDGLILNTTGFNNDFVLKMNERIPIVLLNRKIESPCFCGDFVATNSYLGCYRLTKKLISLGHRKIFVIRGSTHLNNSIERFRGFTDAMQEAGVSVDDSYPYLYIGEFTRESGINAVKKIQNMQDPPTAILSQDNMSMLGVLEELLRSNFRIPEDISLATYDGIHDADLMSIRPMMALCDRTAIGEQAARSILERIKEPGLENREYIFQPWIVPGNALGFPQIG